jgi:serine/threonine-protein kinase
MDNKARQTSQYQVAGTPDYMAPEQAQGKDISPLTDLYAVGVMAFQLLTGRLPFTGATPMEVMLKQVNDTPPRPRLLMPEIKPELEQLVLQLLEKEPSRRPPTAEVVRAELKHIGMGLRTEDGIETRVWTGIQPALPHPKPSGPMGGRPLTQTSAEGLMALIHESSKELPPVVFKEPRAPLDPSFLTTDTAASPVPREGPPVPGTATPEAPAPVAPAAAKPAARPTWLVPALAGGGVLVVAVIAVVAFSSKPPPPPVVEPPPPPVVVAIPPPAKVEVEPPPPVEPPPVEVPAPPAVPTMAQLKERVQGLEKRLKDVPAKSRPAARQFLVKEQKRLAQTLSEDQRKELSSALDGWETKHLKK